MNTLVHVLWWAYALISLRYVLGHRVAICLALYTLPASFPKWLYPLTVNLVQEFSFSPLANSPRDSLSLFYLGHFVECVIFAHYCLICISLMTNEIEQFIDLFLSSFLSSSLPPSLPPSFIVLVKSNTHFYWFEGILYMYTDTGPLSDICMPNIFSHTVACIYFLIGVFWWTEILNFNAVQFFNFLMGSAFYAHLSDLCLPPDIFFYVFFCMFFVYFLHIGPLCILS